MVRSEGGGWSWLQLIIDHWHSSLGRKTFMISFMYVISYSYISEMNMSML